jgi:ABC-type multidrug transport system fused ATPase/permease subunit
VGVEKNIYRFLVKHSLKEQIVLLVTTAVSFPFLYWSYDVPKLIINHIKDASRVILHKHSVDAYPPIDFHGFQFDAVQWLMALSLVFLALTLINGGFKYFINVYKGRLGERMLRRMRYMLYSMILCFPLPHFKKVSGGELIPMITAEVEPLGGFVGEAIVTPIFQGGLLLVPLIFIFVQDPWLGLAAVALYPVQGWLIPKLQRRVNQLGKERVRTLRKLSDRIGETVSGVAEIRANDTSRLERADFTDRLGIIYHIRYRIYLLKFLMKYINNSFDKVTPFFFFAIGGYLVFMGRVDLGALVAVINAQKDLAAPWRELLDFYQLKEDSRIKYEQVVEQFSPPGILDEQVQLADPETVEPLHGQVVASNISLVEESRLKVLDGISFQVPLASHVAVVGAGASGKEELSYILARLVLPTGGRISIGDQNIAEWPEAVAGRRIGYVDQSAYVFSTTIGDNLLYALRHSPPRNGAADGENGAASIERQAALIEAARAGNFAVDVHTDWTDYSAAGADGPEALKAKALEVLRLALMEEDVYQMGLRGVIDPAKRPDVAEQILEARRDLRARFAAPNYAPLVELFDEQRFNNNASVGENLLFGTPVGPAFDFDRLGEHPYVLSVLDKVGLTATMLRMGREAAEIMVELFSDMGSDHAFFEQFSFINSDEMPEFQAVLGRIGKDGQADAMRPEDRTRLLNLPFKLIQARHRLDLIDENFQKQIVEARHVFARDLPETLRGAVEFYDSERYNAAATLQDNLLFGKIAYGQAQAAQTVSQIIQELMKGRGLRQVVMEVGLAYPVGTAGARLSVAQRQKLALARAALKRPDLLVLNEALGPLDSAAQSRVLDNLRAEFQGRGLFAMMNRPSLARAFDRILVLRAGRLVEQGSFDELDRDGTHFRELLAAG